MTDQMSSPADIPNRPQRPGAPIDEINLVDSDAVNRADAGAAAPDAAEADVTNSEKPAETAPSDSFPGWYPDPRAEAEERFWNGREWTENVKGDKPVSLPAPEHRSSPYGAASFDVNPKLITPRTTTSPVPPTTTSTATPSTPTLTGGTMPTTEVPTTEVPTTEVPTTEVPTTEVPTAAVRATGQRLVDRLPQGLEPGIGSVDDAADAPSEPVTRPFAAARAVDQPTDEAAPASTKRSWVVLAVAGVGLFLGGLGAGWFLTRDAAVSNGDVAAVSPGTTTGTDSDTDVGVTAVDDVVAGGSDAAAPIADGDLTVLTDEIEALEAEIENVRAEAEAAQADAEAAQTLLGDQQAALDNEIQHNDLLQTWFTADVRARSQAVWDGEVARVCGAAPAVVDADAVSYTRAMELIGTEADLVVAVQTCIDQQN